MLGCKGLISGHLIMLYCVVLTWPKGFLLLLLAVLRKIFSKVVTMLGFFWKQNTVDSGLTGELPVRSENWAATLWFKFYTTTPNMVFRVSPYPTVAWREGERSLGTTMRYTWGIVIMANQFPPDMRSIRSFSLTACAFSSTPTCKREDGFWCPIHVDIWINWASFA